MAKITRVNGNVQAFASAAIGTERTIFGEVTQSNDLTAQFSADFLRGWGIVGPSDQPTLEDFNGAMYTHGQLLAYLHQIGVAEWNSTQEYHLGSLCSVSGDLYSSRINTNIGNPPTGSPGQWRSLVDGRLIGAPKVFLAGGTYTPDPSMRSCIIECQGGGGGGAGITTPAAGNISIGAPGGCGSYAVGRFTVADIGAGKTVAVGAGGSAGAAAAGGTGGTSSVGVLISSPGGSGGGLLNNQVSPINNGNGVATAAPTGGNIYGTRGITNGISQSTSTNFGVGGFGGASKFGNGASGGVLNGNGAASLNYGAGGGGTCGASGSANLSGGAGFAGIVIIWEYS